MKAHLRSEVKAAIYIIALFSLMLYIFAQGKETQLKNMREVYSICHTAGKQCQDAEERTSTEYLCKDGHCWVEVK